eukprot:scaffold43527_cov55-Phaeocystis_antarctica.AAC.6
MRTVFRLLLVVVVRFTNYLSVCLSVRVGPCPATLLALRWWWCHARHTHKVIRRDENEAAAFSVRGRARGVQEYARASAGNALGRGKGETLYPLVNVNS